MKTITITGNTYPVKDQLKGLGGKWNPDARGWDIPEDKAEEARKIVASVPPKAQKTTGQPRYRRAWRPCGYPGCSPNYCDECDGEGYKSGR